jgi:hypothetical protein
MCAHIYIPQQICEMDAVERVQRKNPPGFSPNLPVTQSEVIE